MFFWDIGSRQVGEMRAVTWRAAPTEFKTGMCEMKSWGLRFCVFLGHWFKTGLGKCAL